MRRETLDVGHVNYRCDFSRKWSDKSDPTKTDVLTQKECRINRCQTSGDRRLNLCSLSSRKINSRGSAEII